jgi:hypothetical protein
MRLQLLAILLVGLASAVPADAQTPTARAVWTSQGKLHLTVNASGRDGCYSRGPSAMEAPAGTAAVANTIAVTVRFAHSGSVACTTALVPVQWDIVVDSVPTGTRAALIYVIDPTRPASEMQAVPVALPTRM